MTRLTITVLLVLAALPGLSSAQMSTDEALARLKAREAERRATAATQPASRPTTARHPTTQPAPANKWYLVTVTEPATRRNPSVRTSVVRAFAPSVANAVLQATLGKQANSKTTVQVDPDQLDPATKQAIQEAEATTKAAAKTRLMSNSIGMKWVDVLDLMKKIGWTPQAFSQSTAADIYGVEFRTGPIWATDPYSGRPTGGIRQPATQTGYYWTVNKAGIVVAFEHQGD